MKTSSISIVQDLDCLLIKKNKTEKIIILFLSLVAETLMFYLLGSSILKTSNPSKIHYANLFFIIISAIYFGFIMRSFWLFSSDKDIKVCVTKDNIIVNGKKISRLNHSLYSSIDVNRWGTKTYSVTLKDNDIKINIIRGVTENDKNNLIKKILSFIEK